VDIAQAHARPLNDQQRALVKLAAHLPDSDADGDFDAFIVRHIARIRADVAGMAGEAEAIVQRFESQLTSTNAVAFVKSRLGTLFRSLA
jgi:hypothetical protein